MHKVEIDRTRKKNVKFTHRDFDTCLTVTDRSCRQQISKNVGCLYTTVGCNEYVESDTPSKYRMHTVSVSHGAVKKLDTLLGLKHVFRACSVTQSCPTLCDHMECSLPGSSVHEIF